MDFTGVTISGAYISLLPTTSPATVEYLVVAGGGGGGTMIGGGGGAGGFRTGTNLTVTPGTTYTVTVGTGGPGTATRSNSGTNGTNTLVTASDSYSFNGTSQYLTVAANAALAFGIGDFTVEGWVYLTSGSTYQFLMGSSANGGMMIGFNVPISGTPTIAVGTHNVAWILNFGASISIPTATWTHVAITRSGSTNKAFINGVQLGANITNSTNWAFTGNSPYIGCNALTGFLNGNISNLRIVTGVSVYTGNFTVPTSPLTATQSAGTNISAITGVQTSLLTLQSATIVDNSTYALSITNNGSVAFASTSPFTLLTTGGGGGASLTGTNTLTTPGNGGSGGGASGNPPASASPAGSGNTPSTSPSQGNNGGLGQTVLPYGGGGGGGATATGSVPVGTVGGMGGAGTASSISGSSVTYAGGGGGAPTSSTGATGGAGGSGGGGNGGSYSPLVAAINGTVNTGGGGGGGSNNTAIAYLSGTGGSGIVIIRYADGYLAATSTTGSPTITTAGGYRIYTWTSSGSITF